MPKLADWVKETVTGTPGTGTITLGGAQPGFCRFQDNFVTGAKVYYTIHDGNNKEEGYGTLTTGTPWTLARTTVLRTIDAGVFDDTSPAALSLTSSAIVGISGSADTTGIVVGVAYAGLSTKLSCTGLIPIDNTIPQNTEGTEVITVTYTPKFADSLLQIEGYTYGQVDGTIPVAAAIFKDSAADALNASASYAPASYYFAVLRVYVEEISASTSARTYKLRAGRQTATGTEFMVNGAIGGNAHFGGLPSTYLKVTEVRQ